MLSFDEQFTVADAAIDEHLGTADCSYKGADGEALGINIILEKDVQVIKEDGYTVLRQTHASFSKLAFEMHSDDLISCGGDKYRVVETLADDGTRVTVSLTRRG